MHTKLSISLADAKAMAAAAELDAAMAGAGLKALGVGVHGLFAADLHLSGEHRPADGTDGCHLGRSPLMEGHPAFLDCPAYLDPAGLTRCALPAEILRRFIMASTDGPLESVVIKCPVGHFFCAPVEFLTLWSNQVAVQGEGAPSGDTNQLRRTG